MEHQTETAVRSAVIQTFGSVRAGALATGIPYTTLHRGLDDPGVLRVSQLNRIAALTGRSFEELGGAR